jgi:hemerythrin superfamily protein
VSDVPNPTGGIDIVTAVQVDHRVIRALFAALRDQAPQGRAGLWPDLLGSLAVHEVAEEIVLFPAIGIVTTEHEAAAEARIDEQRRAEALLATMEPMDPASEEFAAALSTLEDAVLAHAAAEEAEILPIVVRHDDALDRTTLGVRYEQAKRRAPTRPHPRAPHRPPGNMAAGPVLSFVDRVRHHLS